jgi:Cu(I)/Ag(I) efflux system membrane fusion protein
MRLKQIALRLAIIAVIGAAVVAAVIWWPRETHQERTEAEVWTCSMHPQIRLPKPGRCPICGMTLISVSRLAAETTGIEQRAGLETEPVTRRELFKEVRTVGKLDYNERRVAYIAARAAGRVDRIYADFTGILVNEGDHLVDIYSPELNVAQRELLIGLEAHDREQKRPLSEGRNSFAESTLESARTKLRLLGILPEQISEIEKTKKTTTHLTIFAPIGGTIIEKDVRLGQYLKAGDPLYRIADLDPIWLYLNIYEYDLAWVRYGQQVDVGLEAYPGETFRGTVVFVDPFLDDATRTIRVRVNIKNPDRLLKPQMFATATIHVRLRPDGTPEPTGLEGMYVCPMHPEVIQREPGKCSICEMQLEKVPERRSTPESRESKGKPDAAADKLADGNREDASKKQDHSAHTKEPAAAMKEVKSESHEGHAAKPSSTKKAASGEGVLAIPVSAVLDTGRRRITYRRADDGAYELVELKLGTRAHSMDESGKRREFFVVLDGIDEGDRVVSQSGFLLDSQRQIEGMPSLLYPKGQAGTALHAGHGGMGGAVPKTDSTPATPGGPQQ